ncbi:MAG: SGNH/GDSL hydrolase family protein, partial [Lachnospiraceae bacterium]|nr:SGNH/GDSL hydrolase family protein [Lachnospiraceae bacterium]
DTVDFVFQMYGKTDPYRSGTSIRQSIPTDGMEVEIVLEDQQWSEDDDVPGQIRFEFPHAGQNAVVAVKLYMQDGFEAPEETEEVAVDFDSPLYDKMLAQSLMQLGNPARLQKVLDKARRGEDVTVAFIGGSITQGAGAIPINTKCYAYLIYQGLCGYLGKGTDENIHYRKAGVGGTP